MGHLRSIAVGLVALPLLAAGHNVTVPTFGSSAYPYPVSSPRVVSNGSTFLTTWIASVPQGSPNLYGSLSDPNGNALGDSFLIVQSAYDSYVMVVGGKYLASTRQAIYEVDPASVRKIVDLPGIAIASTGTSFLCIDSSIENYQSVAYAHIVDRRGATLSRTRIGFIQRTSDVRAIAQENDYLFFTTFDRNLYRLTTAGERTRLYELPFGTTTLATNKGSVLLLRYIYGPPLRAIATVLNDDGTAALTADLPVVDGTTFAGFNVATAGSEYLIVEVCGEPNTGLHNRNVAVRFDSASGTITQTQQVGILESIASSGRAYFASGIEAAAAGLRVTGAQLDQSFSTIASHVLSFGKRRQFAPVAAAVGSDFLSVWNDQTADEQAISFARIAQSGSSFDPAGKDVFRFAGGMGEFDVASGGGMYVVVWRWWKQIWAARIAANGTQLDAQPILIHDSAAARSPRVTWAGSSFIVTWIEPGAAGVAEVLLRAAKLNLSGDVGAPRDSYRHVTLAGSETSSIGAMDLIWTGNSILLALQINHAEYSLFPISGKTWIDTRLMRLAPDGAPIDATAVVIADAQGPSLASNQKGSLLAYTSPSGLHTAVIPADDREALPVATNSYTWPFAIGAFDATWNGSQYVIAFRYGYGAYIGALFLSPDGVLQERKALQTNDADQPLSISAASNATGEILIDTGEITESGESARDRVYLDAELVAPRPVPEAPIVDAVRIAPDRVLVTWRSTSDTEDGVSFSTEDVSTAPLPGSTKSLILQTIRATTVRVATWNEGGASPGATVAVHALRQRTARH
jgi:hypothetical protein